MCFPGYLNNSINLIWIIQQVQQRAGAAAVGRSQAQQGPPEDFVIATGRQESVRRFIELTALDLGWAPLQWEGEGVNEIGRRSSGEVVVWIDPRYFRPAEVETLLGDPTKAREKLVAEMVAADREEARKEAILRLKGFNVVGSMENPPTNTSAVSAAGGRADCATREFCKGTREVQDPRSPA